MRAEKYIGKRVEDLLEQRDMSRYRLAQITGIAPSAISAIIRGDSIPTILSLEKICDALYISLADFFADNEKYRDTLSKAERELLAGWHQLGIKEQKIIKISIKGLTEKE